MDNQMQPIDDKQVEVGKEKKPYETPALTKLGTVKQLTEGAPNQPLPDVGVSA